MIRVYLGLGANLGDRCGQIGRAVELLAASIGDVVSLSPLYETEPWGLLEQPRFLNAACALDTLLLPHALLDALKRIERELGRVPTARNGPRTIDLDILLYGELRLDTPRLQVPHPGLAERLSVLVPLADIAPQLVLPATGLSIVELLARLGSRVGIAPYPPGLSQPQR